MNNDHIIAAANQLHLEGKKPSVALIRARLQQPANIRDIIECLKVWRFDPNFNAGPIVEPELEAVNETAQLIQAAIAPLQQEINSLKAELTALKTQLLNQ